MSSQVRILFSPLVIQSRGVGEQPLENKGWTLFTCTEAVAKKREQCIPDSYREVDG
jgi:hypothetical protein